MNSNRFERLVKCQELDNLLSFLEDNNGVNYKLYCTTLGKKGIEEKSINLNEETLKSIKDTVKCNLHNQKMWL